MKCSDKPTQWIACTVCEEFHPPEAMRWFDVTPTAYRDAEGVYRTLPPVETKAEDRNSSPFCARCAMGA